jgi:hypothetical protein
MAACDGAGGPSTIVAREHSIQRVLLLTLIALLLLIVVLAALSLALHKDEQSVSLINGSSYE